MMWLYGIMIMFHVKQFEWGDNMKNTKYFINNLIDMFDEFNKIKWYEPFNYILDCDLVKL